MRESVAKSIDALAGLDRSALPGPESVLRQSLPNGIVVLSRENSASPSVVISGILPAGSILDGREQAGLASMTADALMRGTAKRSFQEIYESIERVGASLGFGAGAHNVSFHARGLAEDLDLLLDLLREVLCEPTFPKAQIDLLRGERLTALSVRDQNTGARAEMAFNELAYPNHPYAIDGDGYLETVAGITLRQLKDFHRRHYGPAGLIMAVAGSVTAQRAADAVAARFSGWQNPHQKALPQLPQLAKRSASQRVDVPLPGKSQCDLVLGAPGPSRFDECYLAAVLANNILGRFGLMGRIGDALRTKAGLAYYAYSRLAGGPGPGPWMVIAGVNPAALARACELAVREIRRFVTRRVSSEEMEESQASIIGSLPLQLETNDGVAGALLRLERYGLGLDYYRRFPDLMLAITRDDVLGMAGHFLDPDALAIASAGPVQSAAHAAGQSA
jgi:zinc protease